MVLRVCPLFRFACRPRMSPRFSETLVTKLALKAVASDQCGHMLEGCIRGPITPQPKGKQTKKRLKVCAARWAFEALLYLFGRAARTPALSGARVYPSSPLRTVPIVNGRLASSVCFLHSSSFFLLSSFFFLLASCFFLLSSFFFLFPFLFFFLSICLSCFVSFCLSVFLSFVLSSLAAGAGSQKGDLGPSLGWLARMH